MRDHNFQRDEDQQFGQSRGHERGSYPGNYGRGDQTHEQERGAQHWRTGSQ